MVWSWRQTHQGATAVPNTVIAERLQCTQRPWEPPGSPQSLISSTMNNILNNRLIHTRNHLATTRITPSESLNRTIPVPNTNNPGFSIIKKIKSSKRYTSRKNRSIPWRNRLNIHSCNTISNKQISNNRPTYKVNKSILIQQWMLVAKKKTAPLRIVGVNQP
jgi:hypothetical protein